MNIDNLFVKPVFIVKYGELYLKRKNRFNFIDILNKNITFALKQYSCTIHTKYDYLEISNFDNQNICNILNLLKIIPGISVIFFGHKMSRDLDLLKECINSKIDEKKSFKIESHRKDKNYKLTSIDLIKQIASYVFIKNKNIKVDLYNPEIKIFIEVHENCFLVFSNRYQGIGGLPIGSSGRALVLISGGIDSPVAAHLMMKRGMKVDFLTFITPPNTSEKALEKTKNLVKIITHNGVLSDSKLYVCNFSPIINELNHLKYENYKIIILRRCFFKLANYLCKIYDYDAIITGESLGQVASQTISSLQTISQVVDNNYLILRPLIGYDKNEIINMARKINTYETSILPYEDACSLFVPKNPVTNPQLNIAIKIEQDLDYIDILIKKIIDSKIDIVKVEDI